jgi:hypothetical protein
MVSDGTHAGAILHRAQVAHHAVYASEPRRDDRRIRLGFANAHLRAKVKVADRVHDGFRQGEQFMLVELWTVLLLQALKQYQCFV